MPERFQHLFDLPKSVFDEVKSVGTIVLDTNVLLDFYRLPEKQREDLFSILKSKKIFPRLWFPYQVAHEFFSDRKIVICDQLNKANKAVKKLEEALKQLNDNLNEIGDKHYFIDINNIESKINRVLKREIVKITKGHSEYEMLLKEDTVLSKIKPLMGNRINDPIADLHDNSCNNTFLEEAKKRHEKQIPPGFKDNSKDFAFGDNIIWEEILRHNEKLKKHLIFVTSDNKEDWWKKYNGKLECHPLLRKEYFERTQKQCIFIKTTRFPKMAKVIDGSIPEGVNIENLEKSLNFESNTSTFNLAERMHEHQRSDRDSIESLIGGNSLSSIMGATSGIADSIPRSQSIRHQIAEATNSIGLANFLKEIDKSLLGATDALKNAGVMHSFATYTKNMDAIANIIHNSELMDAISRFNKENDTKSFLLDALSLPKHSDTENSD